LECISSLSNAIFIFFVTQAVCRSLAPLGDRILVKRAAKETQTASGIILPEMASKNPNEGTVVAVGPGEKDVTGHLHTTTLKVADSVLLPEYGGMKVNLGDEELFLFRESDILGKFD
jgi:chaperonin GroES